MKPNIFLAFNHLNNFKLFTEIFSLVTEICAPSKPELEHVAPSWNN